MALGYLISPALQVEDKDGKPLVGGEIVVFRHGTTTPYITWKNFNGDRNPARVSLNALGMALLLADDSQLYDVYCYDRNGVPQWSRMNVSATTGGEGGGGEPGSDLSVLRCDAADLTQSGPFVFDTLSRQGEGAYVDAEGHIRLAKGTWHYDITVEVDYSPLEETGDTTNLVLYTTLNRACLDFDLSYAHTGTLQLSGIVSADDAMLSVGMGGMATGMTVSVADCGIFEVTGTSASWEYYEAGAGIEIDGNIIAVDPDEVQGKLTAGTGIDITDDVISVTGSFSQEQSDWAQSDSSAVDYIKNKPDLSVYATTSAVDTALAGKQDVISDLNTIRSGAAAGATAVQPGSLATVATSGSYTDLVNKPSIPTKTSDLTNDSGFITLSDVPAQEQADWTESDQSKASYIKNKPSIPAAQVNSDWNAVSGVAQILNKPANLVQDASYVHTDNNFTNADATKLSGIAAGAEVNVQSDWNVTDTSSDAYIANKPTIPAAQVNSDWNASSGVAEILNKPSNLVQDANYVHTDENFTSADKTKLSGIATGAEVNVQANWNETDQSSDAYIQNKPSIPAALSAGNGIDITSNVVSVDLDGGSLTNGADGLSVTLPVPATSGASQGDVLSVGQSGIEWASITMPTVDQTYSSSSTNAQSGTAVADAIAGINQVPASTSSDADKVLTVDSQGVPGWATAQAPISAGNGISITNNAVSAKVDGTTVDFNASGELTVVGGGSSSALQYAQTPLRLSDSGDAIGLMYDPNTLYVATASGFSDLVTVQQSTPEFMREFLQPWLYSYQNSSGVLKFYLASGISTFTGYEPYWFPTAVNSTTAGTAPRLRVLDSQASTVYSDYTVHRPDGTTSTYNSYYSISFSPPPGVSEDMEVDATKFEKLGDWSGVSYPIKSWILSFQYNGYWSSHGATNSKQTTELFHPMEHILRVNLKSGGGLQSSEDTNEGIFIKNPVPDSTSSDEGKVLTVDSSGVPGWATASITVDQTYDGTSTNAQSGTAVAGAIATKEDSFDVGTGLEMDTSGATPTLQVEAPVDIVAGPGIVIDNPDGNTLRVSTDENYETVLYEKTWAAAGGNAVLSESANNFQQLRITFNIEASSEQYCPVVTAIIDIEAMLASTTNRLFELTCVFSRSDGGGRYIVTRSALMQNDGSTLTVKTVDQSLNFSTTISSMNNSACRILKVVGIHRIANN